MSVATTLCLFLSLTIPMSNVGGQLNQAPIENFGEHGNQLPSFLGNTVPPSFFNRKLVFESFAKTEYNATFEIESARQGAAKKSNAGFRENMRIYNPNDFNIDVVIAASNGTHFENFLVRVASHYIVDLDMTTLRGYQIIDLISMMRFQAEVQYFGHGKDTLLQRYELEVNAPIAVRSSQSQWERGQFAPKAGSAMGKAEEIGPHFIDEVCSPAPELDICKNEYGYIHNFEQCPAYQFCTEENVERFITINKCIENGNNVQCDFETVALAVRRFEEIFLTGGTTEYWICDDQIITEGDFERWKYELDFYWPLSTMMQLTGQGGGNIASGGEYSCLMRTYVVFDSNEKKHNVTGANRSNPNADAVLLGDAWGYEGVGEIWCNATANGCSETGQDILTWTFEVGPSEAITPQQLDFGQVEIGTSATRTLNIKTFHGSIAQFLILPYQAEFTFSDGTIRKWVRLDPNNELDVDIVFTPTETGTQFGVFNNGAGGPFEDITFMGTGVNIELDSELSSFPMTHDFGFLPLNESETMVFQVTNNGSSALTATPTINGSSDFSLLQETGSTTFAAGQTWNFTVSYAPSTPGLKLATLEFAIDGFQSFQISLKGNTSGDNGPEFSMVATSISSATASPGNTVTTTYSVVNNGDQPARNFREHIYLSTDGSVANGTLLLQTEKVNFDFNPGAHMTRNADVTVPSNWPAGTAYLIVVADGENLYQEANETDNAGFAPIEIEPPVTLDMDLIIDPLIQVTIIGGTNELYLTYDLVNQGADTIAASTAEVFYLSSTQTYNPNNLLATYFGPQQAINLAQGQSVTRSQNMVLPSLNPGTYWIIIGADHQNVVAESNEGNNLTVRSILMR